MKRILAFITATLCLNFAAAQVIDVNTTEDTSPYVFGHNLEHTRAAVNGGISAQMLKNRKFAGKPSRNEGVASKWFGIGDKVFFTKEDYDDVYVRHLHLNNMRRWNEMGSQAIQNLKAGQTAGLGQYGLAIEKGKEYTLRTITKVTAPMTLKVELTNRKGNRVYAKHTLRLTPDKNWVVNEFKMKPSAGDAEATLRYTFTEQTTLKIGALSMMPSDNFHGMRKDVVENLKAIAPRILRWPGGNFAGEYRWKDGLLPVDQRGPLGAATEIETQPYTDGYDYHEINTDDFIVLCREVGAEPMLTINLAWSKPEESAQWVEYCNGDENTEYGKKRIERGYKEPYNVSFWSLGNEMGYSHMEGPKGPDGYAAMAEKHADAMLEVTPGLKLFSSGPYPNDNWAMKSAARLADRVQYISLHCYARGGDNNRGAYRYTTPEEIKKTYNNIVNSVAVNINIAKRMRKCLDATGEKLMISFDEWNQWYAWYRPSCVTEGIYTARTLHFFLSESNNLNMPVVCYFQPVGEGAIMIEPTASRLSANGQVFAVMKAHQDAKLCKVSENDDFSTVASIKDGILTITLINSEYDKTRTFDFDLKGEVVDAKLYYSEDVTPHSYFTESKLDVDVESGLSATLPPHSVAIIRLAL